MVVKLFRVIGCLLPQYSILKQRICATLLCLCLLTSGSAAIPEVVWSVNAGGEAHTDIHGIKYQADVLDVGIASDYGKSLMIQRIVPQDQILYQTERYHTDTFGYDVNIPRDGDYVLVLKFSEVWFTAPNQKVFDIVLNNEHNVVEGLDIFSRVGRGTAHDEYIPFTVKSGRISIMGESSKIVGSKMPVEFIKGEKDNPKINAMYLMKGSLADVPQLPPLPGLDDLNRQQQLDEEESEDDDYEDSMSGSAGDGKRYKRPSGPKVQDPYATDDTNSMLLPIVVAVGAFIPILFCLCKL